MARSWKVAVLLAGCGHADGAEIREAVFALLALDQHGAAFQCLALDAPQRDVVDHATGQAVAGASRNLLAEASRISRAGQCLDLAQADPGAFDALVLPGGFGVAKSHCDFAFKGAEAEVQPEVERFVRAFFEAGKPVGALCISPALAALVLARMGRSADLTLGAAGGGAEAVGRQGNRHRGGGGRRGGGVDEAQKLVTTAAYMFDDARLADVWVGIERCVAEVLRRA